VTTTETLEREVVFKRYYDPVTGQFPSVDPAVSITGQPYGYAGGDPVNNSDPLGLWSGNPFQDIGQAWNDTAGFVSNHRRGLEQVGTIGGAAFGMAACDTFTVGACTAFTPIVGALVGDAVYAESGGQHTAAGYANAFWEGGLVGSATMIWGGVVVAGGALYAGDAVIGGISGVYDYSHSDGCHTAGGYVSSFFNGTAQNAPVKLSWLFGKGE